MKKLAALLASVAVLWGSHAAAIDVFKGEEAIELIVQAHEEGLILSNVEQSGVSAGHLLTMLLDRRYIVCRINILDQICSDQTGIDGKYEE